jgi:pimeloyl-ACP methyl ester carboxylesterase
VVFFASYDGTQIGHRVLGDGPPLICLPGGPGRAAEYLGDLLVQPGAAHFPWIDDPAAFATAVRSFLG